MSLLSKIKSLLPASSRSLHAMHYELGQMHGQMGEMWAEVGQSRLMLRAISEQTVPQVEALRERLSSMDERVMMLLWELYRREGESVADAKRRMVTSLPPATGDMRLYQLASAQLLSEFDAFCRSHGISYWLVSGTLLGAVRHGGFIPWDDDLDVGMLRADVERIIAAAADDDRYEVTVRYDWYVRCRQLRFRYADQRVPCFIDLFPFDPVRELGAATLDAREAERAALEAELLADEALAGYWNAARQFVDDGEERAAAVRAHFDAHLQSLYETGVLTPELDGAAGIVWGIDNVNSGVSHHWWYLIDRAAVFPLATLAFEGHDVSVPADPDRCLSDIFGPYYDLPTTVGSFFDHFTGDGMGDLATREALEELAGRQRDGDGGR